MAAIFYPAWDEITISYFIPPNDPDGNMFRMITILKQQWLEDKDEKKAEELSVDMRALLYKLRLRKLQKAYEWFKDLCPIPIIKINVVEQEEDCGR
jgi:hypothetical protein